jgi:hypothetical protein
VNQYTLPLVSSWSRSAAWSGSSLADDGSAGRFLLHKALFVHRDEPADERVYSDAVLATCVRHWSALSSLHRWLTDNVQAA